MSTEASLLTYDVLSALAALSGQQRVDVDAAAYKPSLRAERLTRA